MAFNSFALEKLCCYFSGELIDHYGYDPIDFRSNPEESGFDSEKLKQIKAEQIIVTAVKDMYYIQGLLPKQIANQLQQPAKRIRDIITVLERSEGELIRKNAVVTMFTNGYAIEEISKDLGIPLSKIQVWLAEASKLPVETQKAKIKRRIPVSVIKQEHTEQVRQKVLKLCQETDLTYAEIAKLVGVPRTTVNKWCKKITGKTRIYRPSSSQKVKAIELYKTTTLSIPAIAKIIQTSANTIRRWCSNIRRGPEAN